MAREPINWIYFNINFSSWMMQLKLQTKISLHQEAFILSQTLQILTLASFNRDILLCPCAGHHHHIITLRSWTSALQPLFNYECFSGFQIHLLNVLLPWETTFSGLKLLLFTTKFSAGNTLANHSWTSFYMLSILIHGLIHLRLSKFPS